MPCRSSLGWTEREPDTKNNCSNVIVVDAMLLLRFSHNRLKIDDGNMPDNRQSRLLLFVNRKRTFRFNHNSKFGSKRWTDERNTFFFSVFLLRIKLGNEIATRRCQEVFVYSTLSRIGWSALNYDVDDVWFIIAPKKSNKNFSQAETKVELCALIMNVAYYSVHKILIAVCEYTFLFVSFFPFHFGFEFGMEYATCELRDLRRKATRSVVVAVPIQLLIEKFRYCLAAKSFVCALCNVYSEVCCSIVAQNLSILKENEFDFNFNWNWIPFRCQFEMMTLNKLPVSILQDLKNIFLQWMWPHNSGTKRKFPICSAEAISLAKCNDDGLLPSSSVATAMKETDYRKPTCTKIS